MQIFCQFLEYDERSRQYPLNDEFLNSPTTASCTHCMNIVLPKKMLITTDLQNMIPDRGTTKVDMKVSVRILHTHQTVLLNQWLLMRTVETNLRDHVLLREL